MLTIGSAKTGVAVAGASAAKIVSQQVGGCKSYRKSEEFAYDIAILGLGYVGLPTALAFYANRTRVVGIDISSRRIQAIREKDVDLVELDRNRLADALSEPDLITFTASLDCVSDASTIIICVPTPIDSHLLPDLTPLAAACESVVKRIRTGQTAILTSTTYVGCTRDMLVTPLSARGFEVGREVHVAFAPERIDPGNSKVPHHEVPRVVGGLTRESADRAAEALLGCASNVHLVSSLEAAELTKLYENTFRAVNISLANEFADVSRVLSVDISEVISAAATKPFGFMAFRPGSGAGGHCIPCDPHYLLWQLREKRASAPMIESAMRAIAERPHLVVNRVREVLAESGRAVSGARILVQGVAYKPGVSDVRESPALEIIARLRAAGAEVEFSDTLVPRVRVDNSWLASISDPGQRSWDLVLVHTVHPTDNLDWLSEQATLLDATYRLGARVGLHVL